MAEFKELAQMLAQSIQLQSQQIAQTQERQERQLELLREQMNRQHVNFTEILKNSENKSNYFSAEGISNSLTEFNYDPETGSTFPAFYKRFETIFTKRCEGWTDEEKVSLLLRKLGTQENTKYTNLILPKKPEEISFDETVSTLSKIFDKRNSLFHTRYRCLNLQKSENQDFLEYAGMVNSLCEDFKLNEISIDLFKCFIFTQGLTAPRDKEIRSRILTAIEEIPDINLQKITELCQRFFNVKKDNTKIEEKNIFKVQHTKGFKRPRKKNSLLCTACGSNRHAKYECYFKDKICFECNFRGHKASYCNTKKRKTRGKVNLVLTKKEIQSNERRKYVDVGINGHKVTFLLDSGSDISIIDEHTWEKLGRPRLIETRKVAKGVSGQRLHFKGELKTDISFGGKTQKSKLYVMTGKNSNLFGVDLIILFDLFELPINAFCNKTDSAEKEKTVKTENFLGDLKNEFPTVFSEGLGLCSKTEAKFFLKENVTPIFRKKRNVPFSSLEVIERELDRLQELDVIEKVNHTDWASPTVYIKKKNGKIRVCADFSTGLNDCLKEHNYPLPSPQDIFAKLNAGKIFSKIDLSDAYLQIKVNDECSRLLCINTHMGIFRLKRLPFGLKVAPALFQQVMDTMLAGLEFASAYLDDILIKSKNTQEHEKHIRAVFKRIQEYGFKLSPDKCEFFMKEIKYLGQVINVDGRKPDPQRSEAIKKMPAPTTVAQLQSFLGLAQYYAIYIPKMHDLRAPLNELLKKGSKWIWTKECESAFQKIKDYLLADLALAHYDPDKEIILATDASDYGVGAVLLHKFQDGTTKPVAHASRTLLPAERNYSQIEKEALAIIVGVKKFHRFIHGRSFILQTDHKPLLSIFGSKKGIPAHTANRLQRWAVTLSNYRFKMEHISSKNLGHADALSRLIPRNDESLEETVIAALREEKEIASVLFNTVRELPVTLMDIQREAERDDFIKKMKNQVRWSERNKKEKQISPFSICENTLLYADRVVIPRTLQCKILKDFHTGHPGISRMKSLMRCYVYWQGMDKQIENFVKACRGCQLAAKSPSIKINPWPKTDMPWQRLHIDYAGPIKGFYYLIVVDSFTKWPEVYKIRHPTAGNTIKVLEEIFSRFGLPTTLVSDNGTSFTAKEFKEFCKSMEIEHVTTPVYHPRSNGLAEKFVDTFKRALQKNQDADTDERAIQRFLAIYRVTPNPDNNTNASPMDLMFARKVRSIFDRLLPSKKKRILRENFSSRQFTPGDTVYFSNYQGGKMHWVDGVVVKRLGKVVYSIKAEGYMCKRHINQLRPRHVEHMDTEDIGTLCDAFNITPPSVVHEPMDVSPEPKLRVTKPNREQQAVIWRSKRTRRQVKRLTPDPSKKKY